MKIFRHEDRTFMVRISVIYASAVLLVLVFSTSLERMTKLNLSEMFTFGLKEQALIPVHILKDPLMISVNYLL